MKPPICHVCSKEGDPGAELVRFADYMPLPDDLLCGHPKGMEWFCAQHAKGAKAVAHLTLDEALKQIRRRRFW